MKTSYADERARLLGLFDQQCGLAWTAYTNHIETQMRAAQTSGDLEGYLALEAELVRFKADRIMPTNNVIPVLDAPISQHKKTMHNANLAHEKAKATAMRQYISRLTPLMQELTRNNDLEKAKIVRDEIRETRTELAFVEADLPVDPATHPPQPSAQTTTIQTNTPPLPTNGPSLTKPAETTPAPQNEFRNLMGTWLFSWREKRHAVLEKVVIDSEGVLYDGNRPPSSAPIGTWEVRGTQCLLHLASTDVTLTMTSNKKLMLGHNKQGAALTATKIADWKPLEKASLSSCSADLGNREKISR